MDIKTNIMEPLLERVEIYGKTSYELVKFKALAKTANVVSILVTKVVIISILLLAVISLSIGASLWLGELTGKWYYGFFCIAAFYGIIGGVIHLFTQKWIRERVSNSIITNALS